MAKDMRVVKFLVKWLFVLGTGALVVGTVAAAFVIWYFDRDLPDYQQLVDYQPAIVSRIYAGDGRLLAEFATQKRVFVPVKEMPPLLIHAFLAAEDKNFYVHSGIDPVAMLRAGVTDIWRVITHKRPAGASTITQQVAKNFLVGSELSYQRKIKEALVALRMEKVLGKDRILELYLNEIFLGGGTYGVAAASLYYFNKSLDELTIEEAAFLAELPKAPNNYDPLRHPEAAKGRRDWVIERMVEAGFISEQQGAEARATPITLRHRDENQVATASYFTEEVRRDLLAQYGERALYQSGLAVRTSLDPNLEALADKSLRAGLIAYDRRHGWHGVVAHIDSAGDWHTRLVTVSPPPGMADAGWTLGLVLAANAEGATIGLADGSSGLIPMEELRWARRALPSGDLGPVPRQAGEVMKPGDVVLVEPLAAAGNSAAKLYGLRQIPEVSGALVALDPHTGRVLALTGGFSFEMSQFDRATQAHRQIGSAIKPFVYLTAMDHGFTPASILLDEPFVVDQGVGLPKWKPSNYTHKFYGPLTLRVGVEQSRNLITARLGEAVGLEPIGQTIERFGIMDHMPRQYAQVLGAGETTPLKLTTAYAMLDNGGKRITPTLIDRIQDRNGVTIYRADDRPCLDCQGDWQRQAAPELPDQREQIADPQSTYQIVSILQGVIERGTGRAIAAVGKPLAGKTGTTNDSNDTWFVGFSPDLAVGVFIGFDTPRSLGAHETGASVCAPVFRDFMATALKHKPAVPFRIASGLHLVRIDLNTGQAARPGDKSVIFEAFKPGTGPNTDTGGQAVAHGPISDDEDAASVGSPADDTADSPMPVADAPTTVDGGVVPTPMPTRSAPATGTGGLY